MLGCKKILLIVVVKRQNFRIFHGGKRHQRFKALNLFNLADGLEQQLLIRRDVFAHDLHQEIGFTRNDITFRYFINAANFF